MELGAPQIVKRKKSRNPSHFRTVYIAKKKKIYHFISILKVSKTCQRDSTGKSALLPTVHFPDSLCMFCLQS